MRQLLFTRFYHSYNILTFDKVFENNLTWQHDISREATHFLQYGRSLAARQILFNHNLQRVTIKRVERIDFAVSSKDRICYLNDWDWKRHCQICITHVFFLFFCQTMTILVIRELRLLFQMSVINFLLKQSFDRIGWTDKIFLFLSYHSSSMNWFILLQISQGKIEKYKRE